MLTRPCRRRARSRRRTAAPSRAGRRTADAAPPRAAPTGWVRADSPARFARPDNSRSLLRGVHVRQVLLEALLAREAKSVVGTHGARSRLLARSGELLRELVDALDQAGEAALLLLELVDRSEQLSLAHFGHGLMEPQRPDGGRRGHPGPPPSRPREPQTRPGRAPAARTSSRPAASAPGWSGW